MNRLTPSLVLLVLTVLSPLCHAQQEPGVMNCRFTTISGSRPVEGLFYVSGENKVPLRALPLVRSGPYAYRGPTRLLLYREDDPVPEGAVLPTPVAGVDLAGGESTYLLLLSEAPDGSGRVFAQSLPDNLMEFPAGACRFINLTASAVNVAAALDDDVFVLKPGQMHTVPGVTADGQEEVRMRFAYQGKEGWEPFYTGRWTQRQHLRTLFLILENPRGHFTMRRITDRPAVH
ncbi:MAG: hypothetical protein Q7Q73_18510 [Verrucomicrobiota bacterium JB024]|nr:hypothetical protein [Verrucomicrobiota bacterium JB024]